MPLELDDFFDETGLDPEDTIDRIPIKAYVRQMIDDEIQAHYLTRARKVDDTDNYNPWLKEKTILLIQDGIIKSPKLSARFAYDHLSDYKRARALRPYWLRRKYEIVYKGRLKRPLDNNGSVITKRTTGEIVRPQADVSEPKDLWKWRERRRETQIKTAIELANPQGVDGEGYIYGLSMADCPPVRITLQGTEPALDVLVPLLTICRKDGLGQRFIKRQMLVDTIENILPKGCSLVSPRITTVDQVRLNASVLLEAEIRKQYINRETTSIDLVAHVKQEKSV